MPSASTAQRPGWKLGCALVATCLLILLAAVIVGVRWVGTFAANGAHAVASPSSVEFGQCGYQLPWPCEQVPEHTIESSFGRDIPAGVNVLLGQANPTTHIGARAAVQVVLEFPDSVDPSNWTSLAGGAPFVPAIDAEAGPLRKLGATGIKGATADDVRVFTGQKDGHILLWAFKRT